MQHDEKLRFAKLARDLAGLVKPRPEDPCADTLNEAVVYLRMAAVKLEFAAQPADTAAEPLLPEHEAAVTTVAKQLATAAGVSHCARCGAPYLPSGQCSRHLSGCQGGKGEAASANA
jgi:hypothetical protein